MNSINDQEVKARKLIYALLLTLVFEGLLRKLAPNALSIVIFFLKDSLCLVGLYYIVSSKLSDTSQSTARVFKILIILIYPLLLYNLFIDPILIVWGGKLYLLYCVLAILMTMAFPSDYKMRFIPLSILLNILILVTVLIGILQLNLPHEHWLNRSVGGDSLEAFSAAGQLRVSSTFSFTGQYSYFIIFACTFFISLFFLNTRNKKITLSYLILESVIFILSLIGAFSTGGKSAVFGITVVILIGLFCILLNNPFFAVKKLILPLIIFLFIFPLIQTWKPQYFAAFDARTQGKGGNHEDILSRVLEPFSNLNNSSILGNGLGVMTNGSEKVSSYASIKFKTGWTESDFSTIIWEWGLYLVLIWYGFRLFVIFYSFRILFSIKDTNYYNAGAFLFGYILVIGITGTFTIQPPIAIYFWICFGTLICIQKFDEFNSNIIKNTFDENK